MIATISLALALLAPPAAGLCAAPASPGAVCSPADDPFLREQIALLMGTICGPVDADRWRRLPPEARVHLAALGADPTAFPTRRARALDGLAALGADGLLHEQIARDPAVPFVVRDAALRGFATIAPADHAERSLGALLASDPDVRIRASAANALAHAAPARACPTVRAQVLREGAGGRPAFRRALTACGDR